MLKSALIMLVFFLSCWSSLPDGQINCRSFFFFFFFQGSKTVINCGQPEGSIILCHHLWRNGGLFETKCNFSVL